MCLDEKHLYVFRPGDRGDFTILCLDAVQRSLTKLAGGNFRVCLPRMESHSFVPDSLRFRSLFDNVRK